MEPDLSDAVPMDTNNSLPPATEEASPDCHPAAAEPLVPQGSPEILDLSISDEDDDYECGYDGGVNVWVSDEEYDPEDDRDSDFTDSELSDFDEEMLEALKEELASLAGPGTAFEMLGKTKTKEEWKKVEANRRLGYNGHSERSKFQAAQKARKAEAQRKALKDSTDPQVVLMRSMFAPRPPPVSRGSSPSPSAEPTPLPADLTPAELVDYLSDHSDGEFEDESGSDGDDETEDAPGPSHRLPVAPPLKRRKLDVFVREQRKVKQAKHTEDFEKALGDIKKMIKSKKTEFTAFLAKSPVWRNLRLSDCSQGLSRD
ncbi:hypothetical protein B0H16DRAFT_1482618 [Mycena metata]|uniref:Uncharacterized protein n=1 Tax=Mycena metata TaxID=1033252 RepID=A0AAD7GT80_9AGAR|nr:hypothetical protein B0H16DRAFT_1482618 [Mycena metata]